MSLAEGISSRLRFGDRRPGRLRWLPILACTLLALALTGPALLAPGLPAGLDAVGAGFALERAQQMAAALVWGHLPPRWMPDAAFGLGYPFWVFHAPLSWLLVAAIALPGGGIVGAIKVAWWLLVALAALGAWRLAASTWRSEMAGPLAASVYASSPLALSSVYARPQALSELLVYALAPWLLLAASRAQAQPSARSASRLALVFAASWAADLAGTLMLLPLLAIWSLLAWAELPADGKRAARPPSARPSEPLPLGWGRLPRAVARAIAGLEWRLWPLRPAARSAGLVTLGAGLALGLALAAWFLLPALLEREAVRAGLGMAEGRLALGAFGPTSWIEPSGLMRYEGLADGPPVRASLLHLLLAGLGLAASWRLGPIARRRSLALILLTLSFAQLGTRSSLPLWDALPWAAVEWQPWRWLAPQAMTLALLAAALLAGDPSSGSGRRAFRGSQVALLVTLVLVLSATWQAPRAALGVGEVTRADIHAFESFSGSMGSSPGAPYLPASVDRPPSVGIDAVQGHEGNPRAVPGFGALDHAAWTRREAARQDWQLGISPSGPASIAFPTYAFPGWSLHLGQGPPQPVASLEGSGWLRADLDPSRCGLGGSCDLSLRLGRSGTRALAEALSFLALLWLSALVLVDRRRPWGRPAVALILSFVGLVILARALPTGAEAGPLVLTSEASAWPHRRDAGLRWSEARLIDARFRLQGEGGPSGRSLDISPGDRLELLLDWRAGETELRVASALVSLAEPRWGLPDILAWDEQGVGESDPLAMILPEELADGLYLVRLDVTEESTQERVEAFGALGERLGQVYLGPLRLRARPDPTAAGETLAVMGDVSLQGLSTEYREVDEQGWLRVALRWRSTRALVLDHSTVVRLLDADDETVRVELESMPMHGLLPTTAWPAGELVADRRWLGLPEDIDLDAEYIVEVELLDGLSGESLGSGRVGDLRLR